MPAVPGVLPLLAVGDWPRLQDTTISTVLSQVSPTLCPRTLEPRRREQGPLLLVGTLL